MKNHWDPRDFKYTNLVDEVNGLMQLTTAPILFLILLLSISIESMTSLVPLSLRGVFVGSGSDGLSDPRVVQLILDLARRGNVKKRSALHVLYLGTATYDLPQFAQRQTQWFKDCTVSTLDLVHQTPTPEEISNSVGDADIIVVGGGNTLYAIDRWNRVEGMVASLRQAMERGVILTGGSAGAICWFDGGHSDSMDPDTYFAAMMKEYGDETKLVGDESSAPGQEAWKYIRVPGLGLLPGLICPHHDRIQSNGVLRAHDFDQMLLKHSGELGIGIDHWAALVVDGDDHFRVVSLEGKPGSVLVKDDGTFFSPEAAGVPGIWIKRVAADGKSIISKLMPSHGKLSDVLQKATHITEDAQDMEQCRRENPDVAASES